MSLNCLKDHIGVQGCTTTTPNSGIFINQLPGIELKMLDKLADEQQVDFNGVWDDIQERAVRRLKSDINTFFEKQSYKLKTAVQDFWMGHEIDSTSTTAAGANYRGIQLELNEATDDFVPSNLQVIAIQSVDLYFTSTSATTIVVYDLDNGELLFSQAVAAPSAIGWTTINIYQEFNARRIFIAFDTTLLSSVLFDTTDMENALLDETCGCSKVRYSADDLCDGCGATMEGAHATIAAPTTITEGDNAFGLAVRFRIDCSFDRWICDNREVFTTALWYLLAAETTFERMYTSRLNEFTSFDQEKAERLNLLYEAKYRGGTVNEVVHRGELPMILQGINLNQADCCLQCSAPVRVVDAVV